MDWFLTWLWQSLALALLVSGALRLARRVSASVRYIVWWTALAGVVMLAWAPAPGAAGIPGVAARAVEALRAPVVLSLPHVPEWLMFLLLTAWVMVAMIGLVRLVAAVARLMEVRRTCRPMSARRESRLPMWFLWRDTGRRARLMVSEIVPVASVVGLIRPVIVLPRRLLNAVTDHELDQIVLHEQAHVQRWDDWARLAQAVMEAVCPFHPAVRWIGRSLDLEREIACDEQVIARTGAPRAYAGCLTRVAEWTQGRPVPAVAPGIHGAGRTLVPRVERILSPRPRLGRSASTAALAAGISLVGAVVFQLRLLPPLVAEREADDVAGSSARAALAVVPLPSPVMPPGLQPVAPEAIVPAAGPVWDGGWRVPVAAVERVVQEDPDPVSLAAVPAETVIQDPALAEAPAGATEAPAPLLPLPAGLTELREFDPGEGPEVAPAASVLQAGEPSPAGTARGRDAGLSLRSLWRGTAQAGIAISVGAQRSGLAVASAFTRVGRSIGRTF